MDINGSSILNILFLDPAIFKNLPPELVSKLIGLITILKTIGILFILYLIFLIIKSLFNIRRNMRIKSIYEKVHRIDEKLDKLLEKKLKLNKEEKVIKKKVK